MECAQWRLHPSADRTTWRADRCSWPQCRLDSVEVLSMAHQKGCHFRLGCREPTLGWREMCSLPEKDGRAQALEGCVGCLSRPVGGQKHRFMQDSGMWQTEVARPDYVPAPHFFTASFVVSKLYGPDTDPPREPPYSDTSQLGGVVSTAGLYF